MSKPDIIIVNEDDKEIGFKSRAEVDPSKDIYRCTALWLSNSKGQVLVAKRARTKSVDPDKWGPAVSGTVERGETYSSNIYKEAKEEIGLEDVEFEVGLKLYERSPRNYFVQWFSVVLDRDAADFSLQKDEVAEVAWLDAAFIIEDIRKNPDKYIPAMSQVIGFFK